MREMGEASSMEQSFLESLNGAIEKNFSNEQFGVDELAREIGISRSHLHRKLQAINQHSASQLIKAYRLEKALELLQERGATVSEISYQVGFGSPSYFNTCFHEHFGYSPGKVRQDEGRRSRKFAIRNINFSARLSVVVLFVLFIGILVILVVSQSKTSKTERSVAVLHFENLSNDPDQEYFVDGIVDEIINHLYKVGGLKVISRTSSMRYKNSNKSITQIAKELNVSSVLEGSVRKSGNELRITAQLIDGKTDSHLWSETYEGQLSDVFTIQSEVAKKVAKELKLTLTNNEVDLINNRRMTNSILAYELYLKGNHYWTEYEVENAISMYSKAIEEDPEFSLPYGKRAMMHFFNYWHRRENWQAHRLQGVNDLEIGLQLDSESIELNFVKAISSYFLERDYDETLDQLEVLKRRVPTMADLYAFSAFALRRQGFFNASIIELKSAVELDPLNANYYSNLIQTFEVIHQYDSMVYYAEKAHSLIPDFDDFIYDIAFALLKEYGDYDRALKESGLQESDISPLLNYTTGKINYSAEYYNEMQVGEKGNQFFYEPRVFQLAYYYYLNNDSVNATIYLDSAVSLLESKLITANEESRYYATLGRCYAIKGNTEKAYELSNKAISIHNNNTDAFLSPLRLESQMEIDIISGNYEEALDKIEYLLSNPSWLSLGDLKLYKRYDKLRGHPRFQKILDSY